MTSETKIKMVIEFASNMVRLPKRGADDELFARPQDGQSLGARKASRSRERREDRDPKDSFD